MYTVCSDVGCSGMCHHFASAASRSSPKANSETGSHYTPSRSVQRRVDGCKSFCNCLHSFIGEIFLALCIRWKPICLKLVNILYAVWCYRHSRHGLYSGSSGPKLYKIVELQVEVSFPPLYLGGISSSKSLSSVIGCLVPVHSVVDMNMI